MQARWSWRSSWILWIALVAAGAPARAVLDLRVLSESADGLRLDVQIDVPAPERIEVQAGDASCTRFVFPGWRIEGSPGEPELAVGTTFVALPPGGSATLRVLESDLQDLGTFLVAPIPMAEIEPGPGASPGEPGLEMLRETRRFEPRLYEAGGARLEAVRLGEVQQLRHQRIVPLEVRPLLYDPATRRVRLVRRLRVAVELRPGAGGSIDSDAATPRLATSPSWERIYRGTVLNAERAAGWRRAPRRTAQLGGPLKSGLLRPGLLGEDEWKIRVRLTGPTRITGATLRSAGFPAAPSVNQLRLVLKRYASATPLDPSVTEIPIHIVDADGDGSFEAEDSFLFWGEHPRDDTTSEDTLARYSFDNVYWLSLATSGTPERMKARSPLAGASGGPATFPQRLVYEEDRVYNNFVYGSNSETVDRSELYFWTIRDPVAQVSVAVPGRAPGAALTVCVDTQEDYDNRPFHLFLESEGRPQVLLATNPGTDPPPNNAPPVLVTCGTATDDQIGPGDVRLVLQPPVQGTGLVPFLDRVQLKYDATYTATSNRVRCTSGGAEGRLAFSITGFTDPALRAFDVTDPKLPATFDLSGAYSEGTLVLTDNVAAGEEHMYVVLPDAQIPSVAVELDRPDDILAELATAPAGTYDALVVVHDSFAEEPTLAQWKALREAQGHRLRIVRTSDVYDAFRGGLQHYEAIHRLCVQAYTNWGIEFVVLVGDGSEDTVGLLGDSGPNFVPARVRYFWVGSSSGGPSLYRNDMNDKYYAQVAGAPNDASPDLLLGRISAGTTQELASVLQKTMQYETPAADDDGAWRKRVLMFSDDEWVKRPVENVSPLAHRRNCVELGFQESVERASRTVDGAFPGDLRAVRFHLRDHSDRLAALVPYHRGVSLDSTCIYAGINEGQAHATGDQESSFYLSNVTFALIDSVGEGCLLFALQSHANRVVVSDEAVMSVFSPAFVNQGKPFVFFGFGCHLNEYAVASENSGRASAGDALGERLLLTPGHSAVASYASTGFEYLQTNNWFHEAMWRVFFEKSISRGLGGVPVRSDTLAARWLLSELLEIAEMQAGGTEIIARYVLLGDPMLRLDGGEPRVTVERIDNGFLQADNRLVVRDRGRPLGLRIALRDEQGLDSLWVVKRYADGHTVPIDSVRLGFVYQPVPGADPPDSVAVDSLPQIRAKRGRRVAFDLMIDECNFDIVVGARDMAGRVSEFVGRVLVDRRLVANGLPIRSGDRVDPRTAFRFEILGCTPIPPPFPLQVVLDGATLPPEQVSLQADTANVNWRAEFTPELANGSHQLRFVYAGQDLVSYEVIVGGAFGMSQILAFPNPMRKQHDVLRIYFHLGEPITGGHLRVLDVNGRTVLREDLASPGVVRSDANVPPGNIGSGVGQDEDTWNYVEIFRDGRDALGDPIANGVYLYELQIRGTSGQQQRRRDKLVIMR